MAKKIEPVRFLKRLGRSIAKRLGVAPAARIDPFLKQCVGVIHIGANAGQEAPVYAGAGLNVLWYEPIPAIFEELLENIAPYPGQRAIRGLLTDAPGQNHKFKISNNTGFSSSIFELGGHREMWPEVDYVDAIDMVSTTLSESVQRDGVDMSLYDALILDTQGSELLALTGAEELLNTFKYIKTEAADFEAYRGCALHDEIVSWLKVRGFELIDSNPIKSVEGLGTYFDITFRNRDFAGQADQ